jgi:hypothetical protein
MGSPLHPDWYPDPENTGLLRWWDGSNWTQQTRPASPRDAGPVPAFGSAAAFRPAGADGPGAGGPGAVGPGAVGPGAVGPGIGGPGGGGPGAAGQLPTPGPQGPQLPPVGQLAQPVYGTAETRRTPRFWWLVGGVIGVIVLAAAAAAAAVAALALTGALGKAKPAAKRAAASPAASPIALAAPVVDHRAGISFRIPAGSGWQWVLPSGLGQWTLGYRKLAQRAGTGTAGGPGTVWAEVESAPLPSSYRYTGPQDLRSDGVQLADELATSHYAAPHTVEQLGITRQGANGRGGARYVIEFRVNYAGVRAGRGTVTSETGAVVIAGRGIRARPAVLFVTVPDTMDVSLVPRIAGSAAAVG